MTREELSKKLDGIEEGNVGAFINNELLMPGSIGDLVVVYGQSDDLMEFRGAIRDEVDAYDGGKAYLTDKGLLTNACEESSCPYYRANREKATVIEALWCNESEPRDGESMVPAWTFKTEIPHSTFNIMEDGEIFCRGIVFNLSDVGTAPNNGTKTIRLYAHISSERLLSEGANAGMSDEAQEYFRHHEEFEIDADVNVETGEIVDWRKGK